MAKQCVYINTNNCVTPRGCWDEQKSNEPGPHSPLGEFCSRGSWGCSPAGPRGGSQSAGSSGWLSPAEHLRERGREKRASQSSTEHVTTCPVLLLTVKGTPPHHPHPAEPSSPQAAASVQASLSWGGRGQRDLALYHAQKGAPRKEEYWPGLRAAPTVLGQGHQERGLPTRPQSGGNGPHCAWTETEQFINFKSKSEKTKIWKNVFRKSQRLWFRICVIQHVLKLGL